jgi:hypothetical protein
VPNPAADEPNDQDILDLVDGRGTPLQRRALAVRLILHRYSLERTEILCEALGQSLPAVLPSFGDKH